MATAFPLLAFIDGLGGPEMGLIFVLILVLFGGQKLPEFARGLGKSIREFKKAAAGVEEEFKRALEEEERQRSSVPTIMPEPPKPALPAPVETATPIEATPVTEASPAAATTEPAPPPPPAIVDPATPAIAAEPAPAPPAKTEPPAGSGGTPPASS